MTKLKWTSTSQYVDIDTGEELTKKNAHANYIITKKVKHVSINEHTKWATTHWLNECRKSKQPITKQTNLF